MSLQFGSGNLFFSLLLSSFLLASAREEHAEALRGRPHRNKSLGLGPGLIITTVPLLGKALTTSL